MMSWLFAFELEEYFSADVLNLEFLMPLAFVMAAGICILVVVGIGAYWCA